MADNKEVRIINRGGPGGKPEDQPAYLQRQEQAKLLNVIDTKQIDTAKEAAKEQAERHSQLVHILKKGFALDEFEYLRKEGQRAMNGTNKDNDPDPDFTSMLGMGKLRKWLNGSFVGKVVNSVDQILTGAASKGLSVVAKFLPAKLVGGLSKVVSIGVGKLFAVAMAAFDLTKGFRDDEFTKKLTGSNSFMDKLYAGVLNMLSGLTLGIFSPEQVKVGTEKLRGMVGPYLDKIFDYTVKPIRMLSDWVEDKTKDVSKTYDDVKAKVQKTWDGIGESITGFSKSISEAFDNFVKATYDKLPEPLKKGLSWLKGKVSSTKDTVKSEAVSAKEQAQATMGDRAAGSRIQERAVAGRETSVDKAAAWARDKTGTELKTEEGLGSLSALYESGKKGSSAVGWDSTGGTSYGKYQIAAKTGTMNEFMKYLKDSNPEAYKRLSAAGPADAGKDGAFAQEWQKMAKDGTLGNSEHDFIKKTHFDVGVSGVKDANLQKMLSGNSALQDVMWSTSVQHGGKGASSIFNKVYKEGMSEEDLIKAVYAERSTKFGRSTDSVQASVKKRFEDEQKRALAMNGKGGGSTTQSTSATQAPVQMAKASPTTPAAKVVKAEPVVAMNRPVEKETIKKDESRGTTSVASSGGGNGEGRVSLASIPMIPQNDKLCLLNSGLV